ncbi:MAG: hypothetical protein OEY14_04925 [Myxococcales bacterium]|nr:hypothetical protein [Myxococcales bacterium]
MSSDERVAPAIDPIWSQVEILSEPLAREAVHPRVLDVPAAQGRAFVFVCWEALEDPAALHRRLRPLIEASLLAELSAPAAERVAPAPPPDSLRLLCFAPLGADAERALAPFGFEALAPGAEGVREALAPIRAEASRMGFEPPQSPERAFRARIVREPASGLEPLEAQLASELDGEDWGARPGALYGSLLRMLPELEVAGAGEALAGRRGGGSSELAMAQLAMAQLDALASRLIPKQHGVIRWIPPLLFQALADGVGVALARAGGRTQWAVSERDAAGLAPPPLLRIQASSGPREIPIGLHLLRWCVMPTRALEPIPPLSEWALGQLEL